MPVDMSKYPSNWESEIRPRILRRAGGGEDDPRVNARCEWCGVRNYSVGFRDADGRFFGRAGCSSYKEASEMRQKHDTTETKHIIIVLTIAHLDDPDPNNCDDDNLAALCQKCHNDYDNPMRKRNAANTRRQAEIENGQMELFSEEV